MSVKTPVRSLIAWISLTDNAGFVELYSLYLLCGLSMVLYLFGALSQKGTVILIELPFFVFLCVIMTEQTRPRACLQCWMMTGKQKINRSLLNQTMMSKRWDAAFSRFVSCPND